MARWALVLFRLHAFEALATVAAVLLAAGWAAIIWIQTQALGVSRTCIDGWLIDGRTARPECTDDMARWGEAFAGSSDGLLALLLPLPFLVGVLAGSPLIAREVESGSAHTTWWLFPSRVRWLGRQVAAVGIPVLISVIALALVADLITELDHAWGISSFTRIGLHGPGLVARFVGAFGIGLASGMLVGRALPAFVTAGVLSIVLFIGLTLARGEWLKLQPLRAISVADVNGELVVEARSTFSAWGYQGPDGSISLTELPGSEQVMLGVTEEVAKGWEPIDTTIFFMVGAFGLAISSIGLRRRRLS